VTTPLPELAMPAPSRADTPELDTDPRDADALYDQAATSFGPSLARLASAYERDPDRRQDLLQDIHFALWRSLASFDARCSLRTWVYRVAHNVATSHALRDKRRRARPLVGLELLEISPRVAEAPDVRLVTSLDAERRRAQHVALLDRLTPLDRQLILLYLEELDAATIGDVTGLSGANVATKIHRIKRVLAAHVSGERTLSDTPGAPHGP
jgi:RNA polymerase sigma-70 factor (ECF subfamily)